MRKTYKVLGLGLLTLSAIFLPFSPVQDARNALAYKMVEGGYWTAAKTVYAIGKWQGEPLSTNNYHVLNYRLAIADEDFPKTIKDEIILAARDDFELLIGQGLPAAAYNRGMFNYRCGSKQRCYKIALSHFDKGIRLGDAMSRDAKDLMLAKPLNGEAYYDAMRAIADRGNGWAAYKYAHNMRFELEELKAKGESYAELAAKSGIADAQDFFGSYFENRHDSNFWLEQAATNPVNRSLTAAQELAYRAEEAGQYQEARKWYAVAAAPRAGFEYELIVREDGLRWRGFPTSRSADVNNSQSAAYELALLYLEGKGGPVDKNKARKYLEQADYWRDAKQILANLDNSSDGKVQSIAVNLEAFDKNRNGDRYKELRPYIADGKIRYVTEFELNQWEDEETEGTEARRPRDVRTGLSRCQIQLNCFFVSGSIALPAGMAGADSAIFIIGEGGQVKKPASSHNVYINLRELL